MFMQTTSKASHNATFSPVLVDGHLQLDLLDGLMNDHSGQVHAPASRSVLPTSLTQKPKEAQTQGTYGLNFIGSSASYNLQQSLENRLKTRLRGDGSMRFSGTWRVLVTPAGRQLSQLVPSRQIMKDNCYFGWPTAVARDGKDISRSNVHLSARARHSPSIAARLLMQGAPWQAITATYCLMMGYPLAWNALRPRVTATQLSRNSQQK